MPIDESSMPQLVSRLRTVHFQTYLLSRGWVETSSRFVDQRRFEWNISEGEGVYELYLPASAGVAKYHTRLLRNIYKLCDIEGREPADIAREIIASHIALKAPDVAHEATSLRVHNSGSHPLRLRIDSPAREHTLYANEAIELMYSVEGGSLEIERQDDALIIRNTERK